MEVSGRDEDFPFELMPLFDDRKIGELSNLADVAAAMRRFLGFAVAVRRVPPDEVTVEPLQANPKLRVQFLRYDMDGTVTEAAHFGELCDELELDGPWPPPELDESEVTSRLIDALFDPGHRLVEGKGTGPIQIQHFACHAETDAGTDAGFALILGSPDGGRRRITLGTIRHEFRTYAGTFEGARPLVVANACGSAAIDAVTRRSFPRWFLQNEHRGFVGTETDVPDDVAADFAQRLYHALLSGRPLGQAVVLARRRLLAERGSPLGVLYVLYGDPRLALEAA